jgi:hypothetical protein
MCVCVCVCVCVIVCMEEISSYESCLTLYSLLASWVRFPQSKLLKNFRFIEYAWAFQHLEDVAFSYTYIEESFQHSICQFYLWILLFCINATKIITMQIILHFPPNHALVSMWCFERTEQSAVWQYLYCFRWKLLQIFILYFCSCDNPSSPALIHETERKYNEMP